MKVLQVIHGYPMRYNAGSEVYTQTLCHGLAAAGHEVHVFTREEKYGDLLEVYRRRVEITDDPDRRLEVMLKIASIQEEMLAQPDQAIGAYNDILGQDGDNLVALRARDSPTR